MDRRIELQRAVTPTILREIKSAYDWTTAQLADELGVSPHTVKSWLDGKRTPLGPAKRLVNMLRLETSNLCPSCKAKMSARDDAAICRICGYHSQHALVRTLDNMLSDGGYNVAPETSIRTGKEKGTGGASGD